MERGFRIGSLCTGYGGLDIAVLAVFGGRLAWCADNDKHVSTILAARYPDVPNLGDLTALTWSEVTPVDIVCAGFPCQDISFSGRGAGEREGGVGHHTPLALGLSSHWLVWDPVVEKLGSADNEIKLTIEIH